MSKNQVVAFILFIAGLVVQGALLVVLLIQVFSTEGKLKDASADPNLCPNSSNMIPIWIVILVQAATGLLFYALAAWAFNKAHISIQ